MPRQRKTGLDHIAIMSNAPSNEKFVRLAELLNVSHDTAFGLYIKFLCWVGQHHPEGDLTGVEDAAINHATGWRANSEDQNTFASALRSSSVHILYKTRRARVRLSGWSELNGRFWQELLRERKRMENRRKTGGKPAARRPNASATGPDMTGPDMAKKEPFMSDTSAYRIAQALVDAIRRHTPTFKAPNMQGWAGDADRMLRLDERSPEQVKTVIEWVHSSEDADALFWRPNILSVSKLRKQFDALTIKMGTPKTAGGEQTGEARAAFGRLRADIEAGRIAVATRRGVVFGRLKVASGRVLLYCGASPNADQVAATSANFGEFEWTGGSDG